MVLNQTGLKGWSSLASLSPVFPNLKELYVANNDLSDVDIVAMETSGAISEFNNLTLLDVSSCCLTAWSQVKAFGKMQNLETLIVNDNKITKTEKAEEGEFGNLKALQLSGSDVKEWESVDNLNSFHNLTALRFNNCPLTGAMGASEARGIVVARVSLLDFLNASVVTGKERGDAEKIYVRRVAREIQMAEQGGEGNGKMVMDKHPRYDELKEVHNACMIPLGDGSGTQSLAQDTINVTIHSMAAASCTVEPMKKRVPSGLQVGKLKQMCKRHFKLDVDLQVLHFKADKGR